MKMKKKLNQAHISVLQKEQYMERTMENIWNNIDQLQEKWQCMNRILKPLSM